MTGIALPKLSKASPLLVWLSKEFRPYVALISQIISQYFLHAHGNYAPDLAAGEVGCYASHLSVWRRMLLEDDCCALICEDDVRLVPNFRELIDLNIAKAPPG